MYRHPCVDYRCHFWFSSTEEKEEEEAVEMVVVEEGAVVLMGEKVRSLLRW